MRVIRPWRAHALISQPGSGAMICGSGTQLRPKSGVVAPGIGTLTAVADTSYASCGDLGLAYQVFGDGPVELALARSFGSHVELFWNRARLRGLHGAARTILSRSRIQRSMPATGVQSGPGLYGYPSR